MEADKITDRIYLIKNANVLVELKARFNGYGDCYDVLESIRSNCGL